MIGETAAKGGFPRPAQPDKRNSTVAITSALGELAFDRVGKRRKFARRHPRQQVDHRIDSGRTFAAPRHQFNGGDIDGIGNGFEHDHRRIGAPTLDLRQVALGNAGIRC